jgi:hypothetical protein
VVAVMLSVANRPPGAGCSETDLTVTEAGRGGATPDAVYFVRTSRRAQRGPPPVVIGAVGQPEPNPEGYLDVFFAPTSTSQQAGQQAAGRIFGRTNNRDEPTTWQTRQAQYDAVCAWGIPNHSLLERVSAIDLPVFVANGDSDPMILPRYSYLLAGLLPNAGLLGHRRTSGRRAGLQADPSRACPIRAADRNPRG